MAGINYSHSYTSSATRAFDSTFVGVAPSTRPLKAFFTGGYERQYTGFYNRTYQGDYIGYYQNIWDAAFTGYYTGYFIGYYTKAYAGSYTGLYEGVYEGYYNRAYAGYYTHAWDGQYTGYYDKQYAGYYTGTYTHAWGGGPYARQYEGYFTGSWQNGPWDGIYTHLWSGSRTYTGQYTGQYSHAWSHQWSGWYTGYYTGVYTSTYSGWYNQLTYEGTYESYGQALVNYSHVSTSTRYTNYEKAYLGYYGNQFTSNPAQYTGQYDNQFTSGVGQYTSGDIQFTGYYTANATYTGNYASLKYFTTFWVGTDFNDAIGTFPRYSTGPAYSRFVNYSSSYTGVANYQATFIRVGDGSPGGWSSPAYIAGTTYYYPYFYPLPDDANPDAFMDYWASGNISQGPNYAQSNVEQWAGTRQFSGTRQWSGQRDHQWTGTRQWAGTRGHYYTHAWNKVYTGYYTGVYEGIATYIGYWTGQWTRSIEKYFDGPNYTHVTSVAYEGVYEGYYTKLYEGQYGGSRTYASQYTGYYTGYYGDYWTGVWAKLWTGPAIYGSKTDGHGLFTGSYTGTFETQYTHAWSGQYTGYYDRAYTGYYTHAWAGQYTGQYSHAWDRVRTVNYSHAWDQAFTGYYGNAYQKIYTHVWTGQYTHAWIGQYTKLYGGAWLGTASFAWTGGSANYTSSFIGNPSFDHMYTKVIADHSIRTGEIAESGQAKVKQAGAWKQAKAVHVKKNGQWEESKAVYIKKNNSWVLSHIGYERTDITITSNTSNFNLRNHLASLGKSVSQRPQLVNIIIDGCDVYSTSTTAALDVSTALGAINLGSSSIRHRVRILVHPDARIIGMAGSPGAQILAGRLGQDATAGGPAIRTGNAVELYVENYGIIAGGGGGGGSGGYPVTGSTLQRVGGVGGYGAGYAIVSGTVTNILENNSLINGTNSAHAYGIHGGSGGLLGQRGAAAGGFNHDNASLNESNDGALKTQYANSGNGELPGAAIIGYNATRTTFINTGNVWGDSKYKLQA